MDLNFTPFPIIKTERLILRQITLEDTKDLFAIRSDKKVMQFIDRPIAQSIKDVEDLIHIITDSLINTTGITWAIALKEDTRLIGTIGFWKIMKEHYRAEIGYSLHSDFQKKGIMQEAFTPALLYAFNTMKLHSIEANVNPKNIASIAILEKNHFVQEAYFKENYYFNGKFLDSTIYSLLKSNYK